MVILAETGVGHIGGDGRTTGAPNASISEPKKAKSNKIFKKLKRIPRSLKLRISHWIWVTKGGC